MNRQSRLPALLCLSVFFCSHTAFAQAEKTEPANVDVPADQEVEITEDNYRQFMELKGERQQRNVMPENAFKPGSGIKKLDDLPEASQKHLRNQLREVIVQGDKWQPGDEGKSYAYVPSEAARSDQELQKQEAEAWGELVDSYHKREAQIYENADRTSAAMASEGASGSGSNTGNGSPGDGTGQGGMAQQDSENRRSEQGGSASRSSSNAANDPNAKSTAGVSQNAMEFLQNLGGNSPTPPTDPSASSTAGSSQSALEFLQGTNSQGQQAGDSQNNASTENSSANAGDGGQSATQGQGDSDSAEGSGEDSGEDRQPSPEPPPPPEVELQLSPDDVDGESTVGTQQNALEYLLSDDAGDGQSTDGESESESESGSENSQPGILPQGETDPEGVSQTDPPFPESGTDADISTGTLSIQDLLNARGVDGSSDIPAPPVEKNDLDTGDDIPKKDGDG